MIHLIPGKCLSIFGKENMIEQANEQLVKLERQISEHWRSL